MKDTGGGLFVWGVGFGFVRCAAAVVVVVGWRGGLSGGSIGRGSLGRVGVSCLGCFGGVSVLEMLDAYLVLNGVGSHGRLDELMVVVAMGAGLVCGWASLVSSFGEPLMHVVCFGHAHDWSCRSSVHNEYASCVMYRVEMVGRESCVIIDG